jgi:hypothetical protein
MSLLTSFLDITQLQALPVSLFSGERFNQQQCAFIDLGFTPPTPPRGAFPFHLVQGAAEEPITVGTFNQRTQSESSVDGRWQQQVRALQRHYTIADTDSVIIGILSEQRSLYGILMDAVTPLHQAFGERRVLQLRAQFSDEESLLKAVVWLPVNFDDPERALRSFDAAWWLQNCHRSGGSLVFDYEIQDAV